MSDPHAAPMPAVVGLILAGGAGRRMGGAGKHGCRLGGRTLLQHAVERLSAQAGALLLSCNDPAIVCPPGVLAVLPDPLPGLQGPLAGVLAGLEYLVAHPGLGASLLTVAVDTPAFPVDLAARLARAREASGAEIAVAASASGDHPVFALWSATLAPALREWLEGQPDRSVRRFLARHRTVTVAWHGADAFLNINTPEQLHEAERRLAAPVRDAG